jgi:hypothetical protein
MKRTLARASLVLATAALLAMPLASPASAVTQPGKCTKLTTKNGSAGNVIVTISGCTPLSATGGKGTGTFKAGQTSGKIAATITWAQKKGTTKASLTLTPEPTSRGKCPAGTVRTKVTGKVTGGTGAAGRLFKTGQPATASVCINGKAGTASIEPGTALKF